MFCGNYERYTVDVADAIRGRLSDYVETDDFESFDEFRDAAEQHRDDVELTATGNDNGSFFCSTTRAIDFIGAAVWDEELVPLMRELGEIPTDPETWDVVARFTVFGDAWQRVMDEIEETYDAD